MRRRCVAAAIAAILLASGSFAQSAAGQAAPAQGFSADTMLMELYIFLPADQNPTFRGPSGQGAPAGQGGAGPAGGSSQTQPRAQGQGRSGASQGGAAGQQGGRASFTAQRDPKLYYTAAQVDQLVALIQPLRDNPYPTPSTAKKLQASVDTILTPAQKAARDTYRADMAAAQARRQSNAQNGQSGRGGQFANIQNMTPDQRQQFLSTLPPDQQQRVRQAMNQAAQNQQLTPLERRQRQIDAFLQALKDWKKQAKA